MFAYVENDPVGRVDPEGLEWSPPGGTWGTPQGGYYIGGGIWQNAPSSYHNYGSGGKRVELRMPRLPKYKVKKLATPPLDCQVPEFQLPPEPFSLNLPPWRLRIDPDRPPTPKLPPSWKEDGADPVIAAPLSLLSPLNRLAGALNAVIPVLSTGAAEAGRAIWENAKTKWQRDHPLRYYDEVPSSIPRGRGRTA